MGETPFKSMLWLSALALGLAATPAWAQSVDEVIVTGSHIKQSPEDAPVPIDVVNSEELFNIGNPSVVELVKTLGVSSGVDGETNQFQSNGLEGLDGSSKSEVDDSCIIFEALQGMTASLAQRGGTWLHLSHTYLLDYGRNRWLKGQATEKNIKIHFVSFSPAKIRDDHVSSRPWWNGYIASRIAGSDDIQKIRDVLTVLAKTTETRSQSIERPSIIGDVSLSRLIVRYLKEKPNTTEQENYRAFMKKLNFLSNGVKFLGMDYAEFKDKFAEA